VLRQENRGRFLARLAGLEAAAGEYVLFLDAGVTVVPDGLAFVASQLAAGHDVWNAHTLTETAGNPYARFWDVVGSLAFADYLADPRTTSFGPAEFDRFPKGTGCFFAPRELLARSFGRFASYYADSRYANDDAPIIRALVEERRIHISPSFACVYRPRESLLPFVRHAFHRGIVFLDGHGRRESRFFPVVVAFYPASIALLAVVVWWPLAAPVALGAVVLLAGAVAARHRRTRGNTLPFALLVPVYALAHGLGMWRGLGLAAAGRMRR
jgi:hypothetical protein